MTQFYANTVTNCVIYPETPCIRLLMGITDIERNFFSMSAHQEMYLNAAVGAHELRMVRHLVRMGMHLVGNDPMDVDSEGGR